MSPALRPSNRRRLHLSSVPVKATLRGLSTSCYPLVHVSKNIPYIKQRMSISVGRLVCCSAHTPENDFPHYSLLRALEPSCHPCNVDPHPNSTRISFYTIGQESDSCGSSDADVLGRAYGVAPSRRVAYGTSASQIVFVSLLPCVM